MSRRTVNVERLELRMRGVPPQAAREAAQRLARELLEELARGPAGPRGGGEPPGGRRRLSVESVEARVPSSEAFASDGRMRPAVARRVAEAVRARIK